MIIILPLLPIVIGVVLIVLGLFSELQSHLTAINTFLMIVNIVIFGGIGIYNLTCNISTTKKTLSSIACVASCIVSGITINTFIDALAEIEFGLLSIVELALVGGIGGPIALIIIIGCIMACCWFNE